MAVTINGNQRIYARDAVITNGVVVGDESISPSQGQLMLHGDGSNTFITIKNTDATPSAYLQFENSSSATGRIHHSNGSVYVSNYVSGASLYFQVNDTTDIKTPLQLWATSTTRDFAFGDGTVQAIHTVKGGAGNARYYRIATGDTQRWAWGANNSSESGSNAGSDFIINRYDDSGTYLGQPFAIIRSTGTVYLDNQVVIGSASEANAQLHISSDEAGTSELVFVSENQVGAYWQLDANEDLVWGRYTPKGTSVDGDALKLESSTGDMILSNRSDATYAKFIIKSNNTTTGATLELHGTGGKEADLTNYDGTLYLNNRNSGAAIYFGVHDTTGDKSLAFMQATSTERRFYVGDGTVNAAIFINGGAGNYRNLQYQTNGTIRWNISTDNGTESGSNAGSNYAIYNYSDAGAYLGTALQIIRSTGRVYLYNGANVGDGTGAKSLIVNGAAGEERQVQYQSGGSSRWVIQTNSTSESGSNAGSNFEIESYEDDGSYLDTPFSIVRSSSTAYFTNDVNINGDLWTVDWVNYGGSSTVVGWSSRSYTNIYYKKVGNLVFVDFGISGTSNDTVIHFSLPFTSDSGTGSVFVMRAYENGTYSYGLGQLDASDTTVEFWKAANKPTWNSGGVTNAIFGQFWYNATT